MIQDDLEQHLMNYILTPLEKALIFHEPNNPQTHRIGVDFKEENLIETNPGILLQPIGHKLFCALAKYEICEFIALNIPSGTYGFILRSNNKKVAIRYLNERYTKVGPLGRIDLMFMFNSKL